MEKPDKVSQSPEIKILTELNEALSETSPQFLLARQLVPMFSSFTDDSLSPDEIQTKVLERFACGRQLYQTVFNSGQPQIKHAIFYKLEDRAKMERLYKSILGEITKEYIKWLKDELKKLPSDELRNKFPSLENINAFIENSLKSIHEKGELTTEKGKIKSELLHFIAQQNKVELANQNEEDVINLWFGFYQNCSELRLRSDIRFFNMASPVEFNTAKLTGCIYGPGEFHNWGTNACWTLAVTRSRIPIRVLSEVSLDVLVRRKFDPDEEYNPSAYSLEFSIAILMGYGLRIEGEKISLVPPSVPYDHRTTGLGNGPIPTKVDQVTIFQQCVYARGLHFLLSSSPLGVELLNKQIIIICTEYSTSNQLNYVWGICYLHRANSLIPILEALNLESLTLFNNMLKHERYNLDTFKPVRIWVARYHLSQLLLNQENSLQLNTFVSSKFEAQGSEPKTPEIIEPKEFEPRIQLIEALVILSEKEVPGVLDTLSPVLIDLSIDNLLKINRVLSASAFDSQRYRPLRSQIQGLLATKFWALIKEVDIPDQKILGEQKDGIETLNRLFIDGQLDQILLRLRWERLDQLLEIVRKRQEMEPIYRDLYLRLQSHHLYASLDKIFKDQVPQARERVHDRINSILTSGDLTQIKILIDAFVLMNQGLRLQIFSDLSQSKQFTKQILLEKLSQEMFSGNEYQRLRQELGSDLKSVTGAKPAQVQTAPLPKPGGPSSGPDSGPAPGSGASRTAGPKKP